MLGPALALTIALGWAGTAAAQSTRYPPEPHDLDQDAEETSEFWEQALHPTRGVYDELNSRARRMIDARAPETWADAEELLTQAIESEPDLPLAYWLRGALFEQQERFGECASAYQRAAAVEPAFDPPGIARRGYGLLYAIGICQSRAGDFDDAIDTYERLVRGGVENFEILLRLGESYMAVGRMDDAIDALDRAAEENAASAPIRYARAVAYDRDGRGADARDEMEKAIRLDPQLAQLESPGLSYAPAEDVSYYLGLAREVAGAAEGAIFAFRRYLHEATQSPWRRRAQRHLSTLVAAGATGHGQVSGSNNPDAEAVRKALLAIDEDLQECLRATPGLLLSTRVTVVVAAKEAGGAASAAGRTPTEGVNALVSDIFATSQADADTARTCVERVAAGLALPRPDPGDPQRSGYLSVVFPVIFRK